VLAGMGAYLSPDGVRREGEVLRQTVKEEVGHGLPWWFPKICRVEVHPHLLGERADDAGRLQADLWAAAREDGAGRLVLGDVHQVLHLCEHLEYHLQTGAIKLHWLADLWILLQRRAPDRLRLAEEARRMGLEAVCRRVFALLGEGWEGAEAGDPLEAARALPGLLVAGAPRTSLPGLSGLAGFRHVHGLRNRLRYAREICLPDDWKLEKAFGRHDRRLRPLLLLAWPWAKAWQLMKALVRR